MQQGPPVHNFNEPQQQPHVLPHWLKLTVCCMQVLLLVFSVALVSTMQFLLVQKRGALELHRQQQRRLEKKRTGVTNSKNFITTIAPSEETQNVFLWKTTQRASPSYNKAAQAYWNQVVPYLQEWDAMLPEDTDETSMVSHYSSLPSPSSHTYTALQQAARLGHAQAQYYVANAVASGILPFHYSDEQQNITVPVDMISHRNDENTIQAFLYWQMAAIDGHVPSQVSLAYRLSDEPCDTALPYYQEASHSIMDMLEQSPNSRAMVQPPMDSHELVEIFSKGAASQLSWSNQPDEPADALRYYHMRAQDADVGAAHTLAQLHHYGLRGVQQNLTLALQYYEMAAALNHVESAGQAGKFYFWGMGIPNWEERNFVKAQSLFQIGAPYGLDGCRLRFRNAQLQKQRKLQVESDGDDQCDPPSVNGLGLLQLFGMPLLLKRDVEKAQQYFELARDMGNADASYNLAMMRLGWKTHFQTLDSLEEGESSAEDTTAAAVPGFLKEFRAHQHHPSKADYLVALQDLVTAANKGHLQAKHRLATIYAHGVQARDGSTIIAKDCHKALKHFTWIVNNANPYLSHHTRRAYKQYIAGDWQAALRNYLAAAEMGHEISQVNAAFLLEQGVCLSLSPHNCAAASLRLWKAAVQTNSEAALRVGDMYYYGRLRDEPAMSAPGPFGWLPYVLYPERVLVPMVKPMVQQLSGGKVSEEEAAAEEEVAKEDEESMKETCEETGEDGTCLATAKPTGSNKEDEEIVESDLEMAARYYRLAADVHKSARANFNLGFLYEWGLGVKQDFPLAKRHYDLAKTAPSGEADLPVKIALFAMNLHERLVKFLVAYEEWSETNGSAETAQGEQIPTTQDPSNAAGHPVPPGPQLKDGGASKTKTDVIIKHLMSWESLAIVILTVVLWKMLQDARRTQQQNRR